MKYIIEISDTFYKATPLRKNADENEKRKQCATSVSMVFKCVLNKIYSKLYYDEQVLKSDVWVWGQWL